MRRALLRIRDFDLIDPLTFMVDGLAGRRTEGELYLRPQIFEADGDLQAASRVVVGRFDLAFGVQQQRCIS